MILKINIVPKNLSTLIMSSPTIHSLLEILHDDPPGESHSCSYTKLLVLYTHMGDPLPLVFIHAIALAWTILPTVLRQTE